MTAKMLVALFGVLFGLASSSRLIIKPKSGQCVDSGLYQKYICKDKENGVNLLVPGSCSKYYECNNGQANVLQCPKFYNPVIQQCVDYSDCVEVDDTDCIVSTPQPCSSCPTPAPGPCGNWFDPNDLYGSYVCRGKEDGTMLVVPGLCTDYYFCIDGHSLHKTCGATTYFNPKIEACDDPSNVYCPSQ